MLTTLTLLNTSILSNYGKYSFQSISIESAIALATEHHASGSLKSAIGHQATADCLTQLFQFPVPANRVEYRQDVHSVALVFKLRQRVPEGEVLEREEIEAIGYEFGLLVRTE